MKSKVLDALDAVSSEYSPDRVVADPELNARFISGCHSLGLTASAAILNRTLLNLRKQGELSHRRRSRRTSFPNEDEYRFAAEMAARFLERRDKVSLDQIVCDPELAAEFDILASSIAPGYSPLQYRWAALNLRKARRLEPELLAHVAPPVQVLSLRIDELDPKALPASQGLYLFFASNELLYVGETHNLRSRLAKHLDHSDNKALARWIWEFGVDELHVEIQVLDEATPVRVRRALELELVRSRSPVFNIKR